MANLSTLVEYELTTNANGTEVVFGINSTINDSDSGQFPTSWDSTPEFAKFIDRVVLPIVCVFGIIGIILTIVVLSRKNMTTSTNCYLMGLAFADLFFLTIFIIRLGESLFPVREGRAYYLFLVFVTFAMVFMNIFLLMSIWITVMLAIERYIAICKPFLAVRICTVILARIVIIFIFVVCIVCRMPNFFEFKLINIGNLVYPEPSDMSRDPSYYLVYPWVIDVIVTSVIPFILLLVLNMCLIWEVRKSTAYIQHTQGPGNAHTVHKEELQITVMLISVIIVFFICQAPYVIYMAINSINGFHFSKSGKSMLVFKSVALLLLTLKSAVNFILYCWFSEKFRMTLRKIFCSGRCTDCLSKKSGQNQNGNSYFNLKRLSSSGNTRVTLMTEHE